MTFTDEQLKEIQEVFWWKCALVNSHYIERGIRAVAEHAAQLEREACAGIADRMRQNSLTAGIIAEQIRARGGGTK